MDGKLFSWIWHRYQWELSNDGRIEDRIPSSCFGKWIMKSDPNRFVLMRRLFAAPRFESGNEGVRKVVDKILRSIAGVDRIQVGSSPMSPIEEDS